MTDNKDDPQLTVSPALISKWEVDIATTLGAHDGLTNRITAQILASPHQTELNTCLGTLADHKRKAAGERGIAEIREEIRQDCENKASDVYEQEIQALKLHNQTLGDKLSSERINFQSVL